MSKEKRNSLLIVFFVLIIGVFADSGFFIAMFVENFLITLFIVGVSIIAIAGLISFYKDHINRKE